MSRVPRLRIGAGERRGLRIQAPPGIRPTSGRLREALFDIWSSRLPGAVFLDLFAGSGAVGIEAVSRGAARAVLVESSREALAVLEGNVGRAALPGVSVVRARLPGELERRLPAAMRFDLIFADPPYGFEGCEELLAAAAARLAAGGEIALEQRWTDPLPGAPGMLEEVGRRRYGEGGLTFYRRRP